MYIVHARRTYRQKQHNVSHTYVPIVIFNEAKINILQDKIKYVSLVHFGCADDAAAVDDDVSVAAPASTFQMQCTIVLPHIFGECTLHSVP